MSSDTPADAEPRPSPGALLREARLHAGYSEREVEDMLNLMPGYAGILECDEYASLRSPAFARGYVRAYGRLLGIDIEQLLQAFDELRAARGTSIRRVETKSLQLQRTGLGIAVGLLALLLLVFGLWWWHSRGETAVSLGAPQDNVDTRVAGDVLPAGES